ncbi:replication factor C familiy, putative [Entamoeba histolytica HM-1:IMSS-B]|uniref:Replication factor C familiy protein n=8 Tax=Entamoeba TaxID=5758 RepID=C4M6G5_ENTH1|nr:replication factor C familiy protein [Entamoeba nuttalli P19]XP_651283.1 replication factor C familiy protein [Entamoeba histolytica HM-1:IMSS]EMD49506.1 replication factor C familiy protein, putative [Entamoeba histolytica KU27]EMH75155.1 replication factor C familiy, putative [Entamoeba histolytica HM-1:IMSS-B]EMS13743.1 replication factor C familiy protein [Entamoeba histolytica HM-3:IMSS]ENY63020.1 replication factor C familiy protein, putative [Entamoeba histolytica HM-1:IMSS-A]GAT970|eukprot:XP_008860010.1 replication factor C familiy protein [Entamoeba nuttalli P19]
MSLPWVEKYRPSTTDGIFGHEYILESLKQFINANQIPHMLFYGPPGTGKTTTALAIVKQLCGTKFSALVLELNASDERGIDVVRDQIKSFASTRTLYTNCTKFIILDESDKLTKDAQNALRRTLEQFSANCRFIFICNEVHLITPAIQSRCAKMRFGPLSPDALTKIVENITMKEGMEIDEDAKKSIIEISKGDARSIINTLQALSMTCKQITNSTLYTMVGLPTPAQIDDIISELLSSPYLESFTVVDNLIKAGLSLNDIIIRVVPKLIEGKLISVLDKTARIQCLYQLSLIEQALSIGGNERTQTAAFVAAFQLLQTSSPMLS